MSNLLSSALLILALQPLPGLAQLQQNQQNALFTVVSVGDGDTIRVKQNNQTITVRLGCIDAPELAQKPWGERSKYRLGQFLPAGQSVRLRNIKLHTAHYSKRVSTNLHSTSSPNFSLHSSIMLRRFSRISSEITSIGFLKNRGKITATAHNSQDFDAVVQNSVKDDVTFQR